MLAVIKRDRDQVACFIYFTDKSNLTECAKRESHSHLQSYSSQKIWVIFQLKKSMCKAGWTTLIFVWACSAGKVRTFSTMAGSCNGVWGVHLPNSGGGDGGYRLVMGETSVDTDGNRTTSVTIEHITFMANTTQQELLSAKGSGYYQGMLLKAFDPYTGVLVGTFNGPLPPNTMYYQGCSSAQSAISHTMDGSQSVVTTGHSLTFRFDKDAVFSP